MILNLQALLISTFHGPSLPAVRRACTLLQTRKLTRGQSFDEYAHRLPPTVEEPTFKPGHLAFPHTKIPFF